MAHVSTGPFEWGVASHPLGFVSGDAYMMRASPTGATLAVVDGLGHGQVAAAASRRALELLGEVEHLDRAVTRCHEGLRAGRGVVLALARLDDARGRLTWLSVGNVQGVVVRGRPGEGGSERQLMARSGVVGRRLPRLLPSVVPIEPGDLLVMATDGIHPGFGQAVPRLDPAQQVAEAILARHRTDTDDALVLAVRYRAVSP